MRLEQVLVDLIPVADRVVISPRSGRIVKCCSGVYFGRSLKVEDLNTYLGRYQLAEWLTEHSNLLGQMDRFIEIRNVQGEHFVSITRIN